MRTLSVFVDESGDFGPYERHNPFYIFTMVFHDQAGSIKEQIKHLENRIPELGLDKHHCFHAGPIIRREEDYQYMSITKRRRCLNAILTFAKSSKITYMPIYADKCEASTDVDLTIVLSKKLSLFIRDNYYFFQSFDKIIVYYDNGQTELTRVLASVFSALLSSVEFRKVIPAEYRLFQVADLLCTMELIEMKMNKNILSNSETVFFGSKRDLKKNYLKQIANMRFE